MSLNSDLNKLIEVEKKTLFTMVVLPPGEFDSTVIKNSTLEEIQTEFMSYVNGLPKDFPWHDTQCILAEAAAIWPVSQYPLVFARSPRTGELYPLTRFKMEPEFNADGYLGGASIVDETEEEDDEDGGDEEVSSSELEDILSAAEDIDDTAGIDFPEEMYSNEPDAG